MSFMDNFHDLTLGLPRYEDFILTQLRSARKELQYVKNTTTGWDVEHKQTRVLLLEQKIKSLEHELLECKDY